MKLLELEIKNVRGIRDLSLSPDGGNFIVWGPNGSGKSAVVDAIDFLLTGKISRLTGKGTGNITLNQHGPHIDCSPEEAIVRAIIKIPNIENPITIKRCIAKPNKLEITGSSEDYIQPIITVARRGQHVLTRREILRYITADGSTRAQEIQELLNISDIENIRKSLVKIQNEFSKEFQASSRSVSTAEGAVNATVQITEFQPNVVLQIVNQCRAILGAQDIEKLEAESLKANLKLPNATTGVQRINVTLLQGDFENVSNVISKQSVEGISTKDLELRAVLTEIRSNPEILRAFTQRELIELGLQLVEESGNCPLCDIEWPEGELKQYLESKLENAKMGEVYQHKVANLSKYILDRIDITLSSLTKILAAIQLIGDNESAKVIQEWRDKLLELKSAFNSPLENYPAAFSESLVAKFYAPNSLLEIASRVVYAVKDKFPESTPEQTAWDKLTRLEENLKSLETAKSELYASTASYQRSQLLVNCFEQARDNILKSLYDDIKDRFVDLYKSLHGVDEKDFKAKIEPEGAALNIEVDFHGRGVFPPHALHSEGHQDSMGLCLYLALSERLTGGFIDLVILDDVVMSVDAEHRRELCKLLASSFPNRQFLITTHDKTWANQLKSEGVVNAKGAIEFYNWQVETGPQVNTNVDSWKRLQTDLDNNDIAGAAARLRRGSEEFYAMVCDSLQAPVKYKLNGRWELGDFLPAAIGQLKKLLKKAKVAYQSWGDAEALKELNEIESLVGQIYSRTDAEQWAINANVHYNNWASFTSHDFQPVLESFQDLYYLFLCRQCTGMLFVSMSGMEQVSLRCNCGNVNWNLIKK